MVKEADKFSWKARINSFAYAWAGIVHFFKTGHNARIHLALALLAIAASVFFRIGKTEALAVTFSIALVWITEMINTAMEKTLDFLTMERLPPIKIIKDLAAGAVLVASAAALIVGSVIFLPRIFHGIF